LINGITKKKRFYQLWVHLDREELLYEKVYKYSLTDKPAGYYENEE